MDIFKWDSVQLLWQCRVKKSEYHLSPSEHDSRQEGWHIVMENPPTFDPETTWRTDTEGHSSTAGRDTNRQGYDVNKTVSEESTSDFEKRILLKILKCLKEPEDVFNVTSYYYYNKKRWDSRRPWAVADENTLPDGESAVIPNQQEVKQGI